MIWENSASRWAEELGLSVSPFFGKIERSHSGGVALLDGARGSFGVTALEQVSSELASSWAWSSDLPHHINLAGDKVQVFRWDDPGRARQYNRNEVDSNIDEFYRFLVSDRILSTRTSIDRVVSLYRRIRTITFDTGLNDDASVEIFLGALNELINRTTDQFQFEFNREYQSVVRDHPAYRRLIDEYSGLDQTTGLHLHTSMLVRHAASKVFQEAHFELLTSPQIDMFNFADEANAAPPKRGTVHYTPPALARTLVESALSNLQLFRSTRTLRIADPACGSGAILHEVLRALERQEFGGKLELLGRDLSPPAIAMAKFTLEHARLDWEPPLGLKLSLEVCDSLTADLPDCDVIIMNPPFESWSSQSGETREKTKTILSDIGFAKSDVSTAFVWRAFRALRDGGCLASLIPASMFTQQSARNWRNSLATDATIRFLGSIGDYGVFQHAMVHVGCLVITKDSNPDADALILASDNNPRFTSESLRALRRSKWGQGGAGRSGEGWQFFFVSQRSLKNNEIWRLNDPSTQLAISEIAKRHRRLSDIFDVHQGVQTGHNPAFVLTDEHFRKLPPDERQFFRIATMTDSIEFGEIISPYHVFFPDLAEDAILSEADLKRRLPQYFALYLSPNKARLAQRAAIKDVGRSDWWGLQRSRSWASRREAKIVSKYFGAVGSFAPDLEGAVLPLTGFAWFLRMQGPSQIKKDSILAYSAMLNSDVFTRVASHFCAKVAGGQFDLSPRYVSQIPLPSIDLLSPGPFTRIAREFVALGKELYPARTGWQSRANELMIELYGPEVLPLLRG